MDQSRIVQRAAERNYLTVGLCFLVAILEGYDLQAIGVVAPLLIPSLGLTPAEAGWSFSAAVTGLAIGAVIGGWASDRLGRKPILIGAVVLFGLFTLATAFASDFITLFLARLLTGLGFGAAMPNLIALAAEASSKRSMTTSVAVMFGGFPVRCEFLFIAESRGFCKLVKLIEETTIRPPCAMSSSFSST
ncbi:MAG: MFS transporter [Proteobacteria bacterium]|nr:MFS transporter [Pseudomonadota bacterium]MDA0994581.1 MFS transporter [Pseudomonadota bacterium]